MPMLSAAMSTGLLERSRSIAMLDLWANDIGDRGALALAAALRRNKGGVPARSERTRLQHAACACARCLAWAGLAWLYLTSNRIGDAGGRALLASIREQRTLVHIEVRQLRQQCMPTMVVHVHVGHFPGHAYAWRVPACIATFIRP